MDALTGLLDGPRARNAFLLRTVLDPPWSIRIQDEAPLAVVSLVRGHAWIVPDTGESLRMDAGDVAVVLGPEPYTVADHPDTTPKAIIHPGQRCETFDGRSLAASMDLGVRTWGTNLDGGMMMLTGAYPMRGEISRRLLDALPKVLVLREAEWDCPVIPLLAAEIVKDESGQEVVLARLLDLLLIAVLRAWFARAGAPAWYRALADPVVGQAVRLLQQNPAHPWTVAALATKTGVSRAALARRFTDLVGEPPMAFLTGWRLSMAADLLRETDATVGAVARQVGYGSSFALSTAFKRERGVSPQEFRG